MERRARREVLYMRILPFGLPGQGALQYRKEGIGKTEQ